MRRVMIRAMLGLPIIVSIFAMASPASAQTVNRWLNAKDQDFAMAVSGGPTCLSDHGSCFLTNGQHIIIWNVSALDQWWSASQNSTGIVESAYFNDQSEEHHMCLGVSGGVTNPGQPLIIWQCNGNPDQNWSIIPASTFGLNAPGCFVFQTADGDLAGVAAGTMTNGTNVIQWPPNGTDGHHQPTIDMAWCPQ